MHVTPKRVYYNNECTANCSPNCRHKGRGSSGCLARDHGNRHETDGGGWAGRVRRVCTCKSIQTACSKAGHQSSAGRHLTLDGRAIVWEHFENVFKFNSESGLRIHRKLTKEHIDLSGSLKTRNKLAEEVLNNDMLFVMKAYQATLDDPAVLSATIKLLENTAPLVEIFHDKRPISSLADERLQQLRNIVDFFNNWEDQVSKSKLYVASKHLITQDTRDDLNSSIVGFLSLCKLRLGKGNSITPAYLNSDLIENHFCQQRGIRNGLNTNPTLAQYGTGNNAIVLGQTTVSGKSNSGVRGSFYKATTPCPLNRSKKSTYLRL
jgi:hypothetical protein